MSRHLLTVPQNDAQLFDMLHGLFGIGDFDDSGDMPWFKFRMVEIRKLKAIRAKRDISLEAYAVAARYCYRHRIPIRQSHEPTFYLAKANRELATNRVTDLAQDIADAIAIERERPDTDEVWVRRLLLARGPARQEVLSRWRAERQS